jgi:hypothetical protein
MTKHHYCFLLLTGFFYACQQNESVKKQKIVDQFKPSNGKIFFSESTLCLKSTSDSLTGSLTRFSVEKYSTSGDTINVPLLFIRKGSSPGKDTTCFFLRAKSGEQSEISFRNQVHIWLNASSSLAIYIVAGKITALNFWGEAFLTNVIPISITTNRNLTVNMAKESSLNIRIYRDDNAATIAPYHGSATVKYFDKKKGSTIFPMKLGQRFYIDNHDSTSLYSQSIHSLALWANGYRMHLEGARLELVGKEIDRWYKTVTRLDNNDSLHNYKINIHFPYETPLDTILAQLERYAPISVKRESQYVQFSWKGRSK